MQIYGLSANESRDSQGPNSGLISLPKLVLFFPIIASKIQLFNTFKIIFITNFVCTFL